MAIHDALIRDYHQRLASFHLDGNGFRSVLRDSGGVILAEFALAFPIRKQTPVPSIRVAVQQSGYYHIATYLMTKGGYKQLHGVDHWDSDRFWVHHMYSIGHKYYFEREQSMITLLVTGEDSTMNILPAVGATAHMTYLTADSIHTVYPSLTFNGRSILPQNKVEEHRHLEDEVTDIRLLGKIDEAVWANTYVVRSAWHRGFDVRERFGWEGPCGDACGVNQRSLRDGGCFHMVFDEAGYDQGGFREQGFGGVDVHFRIGCSCRNVECPNSGKRW